MKSSAFLTFRIGSGICAMPLGTVVEIIPMVRLSRPPGAPPILAGFMNHAGNAIAVIRLARLLDLPESEEGLYTPIVLTKCNNQRVGCLVDEVHRIVAIPESDVLPLTGQQVAGTAFNLEGGFVPVIDVAEILLEQERQALEQWREVEQERLRELETVQG